MNDNFNPTKQDLFLLTWLFLIFILVVAMIIIGGITRITDSGLSMVEWRPFLGFLPPLNNQEWERVFDLYKNTPEYSYYNNNADYIRVKRASIRKRSYQHCRCRSVPSPV